MKTCHKYVRKGMEAFLAMALACALGATSARAEATEPEVLTAAAAAGAAFGGLVSPAAAVAAVAAARAASKAGDSDLPPLAGRVVENVGGSVGEAEKLPAKLPGKLQKLEGLFAQMLADEEYANKFFEGYDPDDARARRAADYFVDRIKEKMRADPDNEQLLAFYRRLRDLPRRQIMERLGEAFPGLQQLRERSQTE